MSIIVSYANQCLLLVAFSMCAWDILTPATPDPFISCVLSASCRSTVLSTALRPERPKPGGVSRPSYADIDSALREFEAVMDRSANELC